jgi:hypothetical protein
MSTIDACLSELDTAIQQLVKLRQGLMRIKEQGEAVEKSRDTLRGRPRPKKRNGEPS